MCCAGKKFFLSLERKMGEKDSTLPFFYLQYAHRPPGSSVHWIFQTRIAVSASRGSSQPRDQTHISHVSCIASRFLTAEPSSKPSTSSVLLGKLLSLSKPHLPYLSHKEVGFYFS